MKKIMCLVAVLFLVGCSKKGELLDEQSVGEPETSLFKASSGIQDSSLTQSSAALETPAVSEGDLLGKVFSGEAIFEDGQTAAYTISFNAVKRDDLEDNVLFTAFPESEAGTMEYFDRMTIAVIGPDKYRVTAELPTVESVAGEPWLTLEITKTGEQQIEFSQADKRYVLVYDQVATDQAIGY